MIAVIKKSFATSSLLIAVATVIIVLAGVSALLLVVGADLIRTAQAIIKATFGSTRGFGETLVRATPLLIIAVTLAPSLRAGIYNIGAPGQMGMGALAATVVALNLPGESKWIVFPACAIAAALSGSATALLPGFLKARWKVNEIVPTLAMNFIVLAVLGYLLNGPMQGDYGNLPQSHPLPPSSLITAILPGTRLHIGLLVALAAVPLFLALNQSLIGYRLRLLSASIAVAKRARVNPTKYVMWLFAVAGAGGGLAGWMQVAAIDQRLYTVVADPVGYAGLFVALLGALHPLGILLAAFLLGALLHGGEALQVGAGVSPEIIQVLLGLILFAYAAMPRGSISTIRTTN